MSYPPPPGAGAPGGFPPPGGGYPPPPGGGFQGGGFAPPPAQPTNGLAIAALITGIITVLSCGFLFPLGLVAVVLGVVALGKAKNHNGSGKGLAIGGIATGVIGLLGGAALLFLVFLAADTADDAIDSAVCSVDEATLESAVSSYRAFEQADPTSQDQLVSEGYLTETIPEFDFEIADDGTVNATPVAGEGCD